MTAIAQRAGMAVRLQNLPAPYKIAIFAAEFAVFLAVWEVVVGAWGWINPIFFPPPTSIAEGLGELISSGALEANATVSIRSWLTGFAIAVAIGVPLGLAMGSSVGVDRVVGPMAWTIYATPMLAYQPLSLAWFGFGNGPVIFLVAMGAVFPILLNVSAGIRTTDPSLINAARVFGGSRLQLYWKIFLPSTVSFLFAGLRQAAAMATIAMVVAELTGPPVGMGALIVQTANTYRPDQSYAAIGIVVLWSVTMTALIGWLGGHFARHTRTRGH